MRTRTISPLGSDRHAGLRAERQLGARSARREAGAGRRLRGRRQSGYSWEGGALTYQGKKYQVEVKGLSVGDVGITKAEASGG